MITTEQLETLEHDVHKLGAWLENFEKAKRVLAAAASIGRGFREQAQAEAAAIVAKARESAEQQARDILEAAQKSASNLVEKATTDAESVHADASSSASHRLRRLTEQVEAKKRKLGVANAEIAAATAQFSALKASVQELREQLHST